MDGPHRPHPFLSSTLHVPCRAKNDEVVAEILPIQRLGQLIRVFCELLRVFPISGSSPGHSIKSFRRWAPNEIKGLALRCRADTCKVELRPRHSYQGEQS